MSAFKFGQHVAIKLAAGPKGVTGMLTGLLQTPSQAGQKAMLAARRELKPMSPYAPKGILENPNKSWTPTPGWAVDPKKGPGGFYSGPDFVPRRQALQSVGQSAARAQLAKQIGTGALVGTSVAGAYGRGPLALPQQAPEIEVRARRPVK